MSKRYFYITQNDFEDAEVNGIDYELLSERVRKRGWDIDKAVNMEVSEWEHITI